MGLPRFRAKRDATEASIVDALERAGCSVWRINQEGLPDLLVVRAGQITLLECKSGPQGRLTKAQQENFERGLPFSIVWQPLEALHAVGLRRE